jgi:glycerol-3-phosphate acyltransferase PlsY
MWIFWVIMSFLSGSIPFSVLVVSRFLGRDVRNYGDGNPGTVNAFKAGGLRYGLAVGMLDFLKGALPIGIAAQFLGWRDFRLAAVAISCLLGSAYSPWLRFRGGKSIACTFGVWTGVLMYEAPLFLGAFLSLYVLLLRTDAWSAVLGFFSFLLYLWFRGSEASLLMAGAFNALILVLKHAADLAGGPRPRPWLARLAGQR